MFNFHLRLFLDLAVSIVSHYVFSLASNVEKSEKTKMRK